MLINKNNKSERVKFVSYTGKHPNLCRGMLTLDIDGKIYKFGNKYIHKEKDLLPEFWSSGGECGFAGRNYTNPYTNQSEWIIDSSDLPEELQQYTSEIDEVFNENVPHGCCGGCL